MPLWLIGMMGSGKSEVGQVLATRTGKPFMDTDLLVEDAAGLAVVEVFEQEGEVAFRVRESEAIRTAAQVADAVVATGGGAVLLDDNVRSMKSSGPVVWLQADPVILAARIGHTPGRPLLTDVDVAERLSVILENRRDAYESAADHIVATDDFTVEEVALRVEEIWNAS
ncbi:MAG: shikimate kinase [Acidimicrobiia bacterium]